MIRQSSELAAPRTRLVRHRLSGHYEALYRRVRFPRAGEAAPHTVGVTSSLEGEGVSTVAINLAISAAAGGCRTLLVDANFVSPSIARRLRLAPRPGLADLLGADAEFDECIYAAQIERLHVLPAGPTMEAGAADVDWSRLEEVARRAAADYDLVVFDLPPAQDLSSCLTVAAMLDGVLLVVEAERTAGDAALRSKRRLAAAGAKLLGVILNKGR